MFTVIIPLRSGSKRIKGKNTKLLDGKSLFTYTLDNALKSEELSNIIITTDDKKVIEILNNDYQKELNGGKIEIIIRDEELSNDSASSIDVILDVINKKKLTNNIILLQATSPFRSIEDINNSINLFKQKENYSLVSMNKVLESPYWQFKVDINGKIENLFDEKYLTFRSQDLPDTYIPNGSIFISSVKMFLEKKTFYIKNIIPYIMDNKNSIDIDEPEDFEYCEFLLNKI